MSLFVMKGGCGFEERGYFLSGVYLEGKLFILEGWVFQNGLLFLGGRRRGMKSGAVKQTDAGGYLMGFEGIDEGVGNAIHLLRLCFEGPFFIPLSGQAL